VQLLNLRAYICTSFRFCNCSGLNHGDISFVLAQEKGCERAQSTYQIIANPHEMVGLSENLLVDICLDNKVLLFNFADLRLREARIDRL